MGRIGFVFSGQGDQFPGMGKDLYEEFPAFAEVIDRADAIVDFDLKKLMFEGPEDVLSRTEFTQPALAAFGSGVVKVLREAGIRRIARPARGKAAMYSGAKVAAHTYHGWARQDAGAA